MSADTAWLAALYLEHGMRLRRFVFGILRDREAAKDVVQATFAKAAQAAGDVHPAAIKSWLYRVAFNEAVDWRRRASVDRKTTLQLGELRHGCAGEKPGESLMREETVEEVRRAMQSLSPKQQQVIRARVYEDKKFSQIAAEMGAPLPTVITHMRRALEQLRQKMKRRE